LLLSTFPLEVPPKNDNGDSSNGLQLNSCGAISYISIYLETATYWLVF